MEPKDIRSDLEKMSRLLDQYWTKDVMNSNSIGTFAKNDKLKEWNYRIENLVFRNIEVGQNYYPNEKIVYSQVKMALNMVGKYEDNELFDPIKKLEFNISIFAEIETLGPNKKIIASWHLEKNDKQDANSGSPKFFHPEYHFHFGGKSMTNVTGKEYGNLLLLGAPRLAHLPMDGILAIDFVIRNFYTNKKHYKLTSNHVYKDILKNSQDTFWRPYILGLASHWTNANIRDENLKPSKLLPNLIKNVKSLK